jgi:hypothetical protein
MNAPSSESPGLSLPPPLVEQNPNSPAAVETAQAPGTPLTPEQAPIQGQSDPTAAQSAMPSMPSAPLPLPAAPTGVAVSIDNTTAMQAIAPVAADDSDLIEKEWVSKAKEIVEHTRQNPYQQSQELNLFKADYMKKRYNKTLKLSE